MLLQMLLQFEESLTINFPYYCITHLLLNDGIFNNYTKFIFLIKMIVLML